MTEISNMKINEAKTLLIADDHPIFRLGLREVLNETSHYKIITEAEDGEQAIKRIQEYKPDIAILDISMPKVGGLDVIAQMRHWTQAPLFVLLSLYDDEVYIRKALAYGVSGYILKENTDEELLKCLDAVNQGERYLCSSIREKIVSSDNSKLNQLSQTERQIFSLVADLKTNTEIAQILSVSVRTIENHRFNICKKLNIKGKNALLKYALSFDEPVQERLQ